MNTTDIREALHRQIDRLPDELVEEIADFTLFITARRQRAAAYGEWDDAQWQAFVLEQFFREDDEVTYSLEDAKEVYHP
ncbi:MAG: hypothetical protein ACP5HG_09195 [Anaerolineae bacterium]